MTTSTESHKTVGALVVATADGLALPNRNEPALPGRTIGSLAVDGDMVWALVDSTELHRVRGTAASELAAPSKAGVAPACTCTTAPSSSAATTRPVAPPRRGARAG